MSWLKTSPSWSLKTWPMKPHLLPSAAMPASVLAADPPQISRPAPMARVERLGLVGVDQLHAALGERMADNEIVLFAGNDVDDGIADGDDVEVGSVTIWVTLV